MFNNISTPQNLMGFCCMFFLLLLHWFVPRFRNNLNDGILNAIGGGVALGYVFMHAIPDFINTTPQLLEHIQFGKRLFGKTLDHRHITFLLMLMVVIGFCVWYALEKIAHDRTKQGKESGNVIYISHLTVMAYTGFFTVFMIPTMVEENLRYAIIFIVVMGFEFILEDYSLTRHFPVKLNHKGRLVVMFCIIAGWLASLVISPRAQLILSSFTGAFITGGLIVTTAKTEFSLLEGRSHFPTFLLSLLAKILIALLMLVI